MVPYEASRQPIIRNTRLVETRDISREMRHGVGWQSSAYERSPNYHYIRYPDIGQRPSMVTQTRPRRSIPQTMRRSDEQRYRGPEYGILMPVFIHTCCQTDHSGLI